MPFIPTRFIHASNLRLDHQPQGVGAVSKDAQILLEDCTLDTFQEIIKACLEQEIDFLLLTGNTFIDEDHSIRARIALLDGFMQLAAEDIQVVIIPGLHDPLSAWDLQTNWPTNVTFLAPQDQEIHDILRNGEAIATLQILGTTHQKKQQPFNLKKRNQLFNQEDQRALSIGLIAANSHDSLNDPTGENSQSISLTLTSEFQNAGWQSDESSEVEIDYIALYKGTQRHTFEMHPGLAHHPGTSQGLNFDEHKQTGVTLVSVEPEAQLDLRLLKVAAVRWLVLELDLEPETNRHQFKQLMKEALFSRKPASHEGLWMVRWQIKGSGELFDSFRSFKTQSELSKELAQEVKDRLPILLEQTFYLQYREAHVSRSSADLMHRFQRQIDSFRHGTESPLQDLLTHSTQLDQTWHDRLGALTGKLNEETIFNSALRNGQTWLNIPSDEELHS